MQVYDPPVEDYRFLLDILNYDRIHKLPGHEDYDLDTIMALIEQGAKFAKEKMLPLNKVGDEKGLQFDPESGDVKTPKGFTALYKELCEQGYPGITHSPEHGGAGAPHMLSAVFNEVFCSANKSFSMAPGLTHGLVEAIDHHGTDELRQRYLLKLVSGEWTGTMCLTEPQCGTDLGLLTTKAVPTDDGAYALTGTKIWITFGEHDLADNIIHLVLARLPDAPDGIKGISVFVVPKFLDDGTRNGVKCGGLEHKMGIHASPTCVINLEDAKGWLVGEPHKGMRAMFTMMNAARLFVGIEGLALGEIAYQTALAFAKDRKQSRSLDADKRDPNSKADNILVHPDVRRQLLNIKSTNEGMRVLTTWMGMNIDVALKSTDEEEAAKAQDLIELMTPVIKGFCTERGFTNINDAMQVTGGAGYTTDWSIEQYLRDERIALIYEGTNHIQALDLVGRKLPREGGRYYRTWANEVQSLLDATDGKAEMAEVREAVKEATDKLNELTMTLGMKGMQDPEEAAAVASNYLTCFGLTALGYCWLYVMQAIDGREGKAYATKRKLAHYYTKQVMPEIYGLARIMDAGKAQMMGFDVDEL
jgi:alkylation response protein AidB-like acyl-CoA dehydrogenase